MASRKGDKLPATIGMNVMPTNEPHFTPKIPGKWSLILPASFCEGNMKMIHIATTALPGPELQPFLVNPFLPMHMGLHPSFLPHNLEPLPGTVQNASLNNIMVNPWHDTDPQYHPDEYPPASNSLQNPLDTNSKRLEYLLNSTLATALTIQTSGISILGDILSPRAQNTLKVLNALVSVEMPVSGPRTIVNNSPAHFKYVKKVTHWL